MPTSAPIQERTVSVDKKALRENNELSAAERQRRMLEAARNLSVGRSGNEQDERYWPDFELMTSESKYEHNPVLRLLHYIGMLLTHLRGVIITLLVIVLIASTSLFIAMLISR